MSRIIVATNPACDVETLYLEAWQSKVADLAMKQKDTIIFELNQEKTNKEDLTKLIQEENPQLVILNGHGSYDSIVGFYGGVLIKAMENEEILSKRIIHSMACSAGKILGPSCIKIGALAYIGYKEEFKFVYLRNHNTKEEKFSDDIANLFFEPAFQAVFSLINGYTVKESFDVSQRKG